MKKLITKLNRRLVIGLLVAMALIGSGKTYATIYYWNGSGAYTTAGSWNTARAGGGSPATVFTGTGDIFIVQGMGATTNGTNSGGTSLATSNQTVTASSSSFALAGTLEIEGGATINMTAKQTIANIIIDGDATSYGTVAATSSGYFVSSGTTTCNGLFTMNNTGSNASYGTLNINGNNASSVLSANTKAFTVTTLNVNGVGMFTLTGTAAVTVSGTTTCNGTINLNNTATTTFATLNGTGILNNGYTTATSKPFVVTTVSSSTFLNSNSGGTVNYKNLSTSPTLLASYCNLSIDDYNTGVSYTPATTIVYGNLTLPDFTNTANVVKIGGNGLTVNGNVTIGNATLNCQTFTVTAKGNVAINNASGTISGTTGNITLGGTGAQTLSGSGTFPNIILSNSGNISLGSDITWSGILSLNNQILNIGSYQLTMGGSTSALYSGNGSGTSFSSTVMLKSDGISGKFKKNAGGAALSSFVFPIGIGSNYLPATITTSGASNVTVQPVSGAHTPATSTTQIVEYWKVTSSAAFNVTATFGFPDAITPASNVGSYYTSSWNVTAIAPTGSSSPYAIAFSAQSYTAGQIVDYTVQQGVAETAPTLTATTAPSTIGTTTASAAGGTISDIGSSVATSGICYGTSASPTIAGNKTTDGPITASTWTNSSFSSLTANTLYYTRAYATTSGGTTGYAPSDVTFTTLPNAPAVSTAGTATSSSIICNWTAPSPAGTATYSYYLEYGTDNTFATTTGNATIASGTLTKTISSGLSPGTTYYYHVKATNLSGAQSGAWSSSYGTTATLAATLSTPSVSTGATIITNQGFTANWGAITNASSYTVKVFDATGATEVTAARQTGITGTSVGITGLANNTTYTYKVTAIGDGTHYTNSAESVTSTTVRTKSMACLITGFSIGTQISSSITGTNIAVLMPSDANLTVLTPTITLSVNATVSPASAVSQDFTNPVPYTVTAEDGVSQTVYSVTVTKSTLTKLSTPDVSSGATSPTNQGFTTRWAAVSNVSTYTVKVYDATGTTEVVAARQTGLSGTSVGITGLTANTTYTYKVTAIGDGSSYADSDESSASATVRTLSTASAITAFNIIGQSGSTTIGSTTISLQMPYGQILTSLSPSITVSGGASVNPLSGAVNGFSSPQHYIVTAEDGTTTTDYTVTITNIAPSGAKAITALTFSGQVGSSVITEGTHTIDVVMPVGTYRYSLTPASVSKSDFSTISPDITMARDFRTSKTYTITAQDGSTQDYTVNVTNQLASTDNAIGYNTSNTTMPAAGTNSVTISNGTATEMAFTSSSSGSQTSTATGWSGSGSLSACKINGDAGYFQGALTTNSANSKITVLILSANQNNGSPSGNYAVVFYSDYAATTVLGTPVQPTPTANNVADFAHAQTIVTVPSGAKAFRVYRVVTINSVTYGTSTSIYIFYVKATVSYVSATQLTSPSVGAASNPSSTGFTANWSDGSNEIGYTVKVYQGASLVKTVTGITANANSAAITGLSAGTAYTFKVTAIGDGDTYTDSNESSPSSVTTSAVITASTGSNGSISPSGATDVINAGSQAYTITANTNYHILNVLVDGSTNPTAIGSGSYTFTNVVAAHTISATFIGDTHTVTYNGNGSNGGSAPAQGSGAYTSSITLSDVGSLTKTGYTFSGWNTATDGSGTAYAGGASYTVPASDNTLYAQWIINAYAISASTGLNGTVSPSGSTSVNYNSGQAYSITPSAGYYIADVLVDGVSNPTATTTGSYTFSNVSTTHTISATFASGYAWTGAASDNTFASSGNWQGGSAPTADAGSDVLVVAGTLPLAGTTVFGNVNVAAGCGLKLNGQSLTINSTASINGSLQFDDGSAVSGTVTYGSVGTLILNNSSIMYLWGTPAFWPATNGPVNVTVQNTGGIELQIPRTVNGVFQTSAGIRNTFGNDLTVTGTVKLNNGGYFDNFSPTYSGSSATLEYATGTAYGIYNEWINGSSVGYGVPQHVTISNSTTVNLSGSRTIPGTLALTAGTLATDVNTLTLNGAISGTGTISTSTTGTLVFGGAAVQTLANTNLTGSVVNNLVVNAGSQLSLSGSTITAANFTINSNGSGTGTILDGGLLTVTGTTNVNQHLTASRNWYFSSPVASATGSVVLGTAEVPTGNSLWQYNEGNANWNDAMTPTTPLTVTRGFIANNTSSGPITFNGTLNSGDITTPALNRSGATKAGFNLIGNPYPSYVNLATFSSTNDTVHLETTYWLRSKNSGGNYVFDTYNLKEPGSSISLSSKPVAGVIAPMQAFWVRVKSGFSSGSLTFHDSKRSHIDNATNVFRAPAAKTQTQSLLRLQVSNGLNYDEAVLYSNTDASNGYDDYDSQKYPNGSASIPEIYTLIGSEQLAINGMNSIPYDTEIPLGFSTGTAGDFSLKASQIVSFDPSVSIYLIDKNNGTNTLLTQDVVYPFSSGTTTNNTSRFALVFRSSALSTGLNPADTGSFWISTNANGQIQLNGMPGGSGTVAVYNAVGQKLVSENLTSTTHALDAELVPAVYFVTVSTNGRSVTRKVIIN